MTEEGLHVEYWSWFYHENRTGEEVEDEEFDKEAILAAMEQNPDDWETVIADGAGN
jgi:hypothetical protein